MRPIINTFTATEFGVDGLGCLIPVFFVFFTVFVQRSFYCVTAQRPACFMCITCLLFFVFFLFYMLDSIGWYVCRFVLCTLWESTVLYCTVLQASLAALQNP